MTTAVLDPTRKSTYKFINTLVEEMGPIFPDAYFHIGGDEVRGEAWLADPQIAAFMKKKGYTKPAQLQAWFNQQLEDILKKHNKKMIGWDEILDPALPKTILIQSWRGEASLSEGVRQGYQGILSAPYYLDGQKNSAQMFLADPIPADTTLTADQQKLILGGEVCMWAEQLNTETIDSRVWPRTMAVAERFWSPQGDRDAVSYTHLDVYKRQVLIEVSGDLRTVGSEIEDGEIWINAGQRTAYHSLCILLGVVELDDDGADEHGALFRRNRFRVGVAKVLLRERT